ncbi:hypothetical protein [Ruegeria sp. A3M17]|uniref:hypothetical protein n=1 Tax=Ruegeria sp. A3M17 TaxID=2267229 RepID=UPI000DEACBEA|nr:hypothetical protein [Ruegeria sp. A3M17]RBW63351.1 hypothetical protein DS906_00735 [Ruegeria sp. A3M17]
MMMQNQITAHQRVYSIPNVPVENTYTSTSLNCHDLAALAVDLRCHGGLTEREVLFIVSRVIDTSLRPLLRNFEALLFATAAAAL